MLSGAACRYRYINRGLYERDKLTFVLIVTLKILITAKKLNSTDMTLFLRGGAYGHSPAYRLV